jgi:hypothetical protein
MQDAVEAYKIKEQKRLNKRTWTSFYTDIKERLAALFHRTAMQKYNEGVQADNKRRVVNWS